MRPFTGHSREPSLDQSSGQVPKARRFEVILENGVKMTQPCASDASILHLRHILPGTRVTTSQLRRLAMH